jgi:hypothetical protein
VRVDYLHHPTIYSARFCLDGVSIEVEPCADGSGAWRARRVNPTGGYGPWQLGRHAWQALEAAAAPPAESVTAA